MTPKRSHPAGVSHTSLNGGTAGPALLESPSALRSGYPCKRAFDLIAGLIMCVILAPVAVVVAVLVKLSSPGPILFAQPRLGKDGRPFTLYKFRTMYHGVDSTVHEEYFLRYLNGEPASEEQKTIYKLRCDERITPIGHVLRILGVDEIPQLISVIRGDMSIVGPRPPIGYEVKNYSERHRMRLIAKPGITGLWQVRGRDTVPFEDMVEMDLEYVARQSLILDLELVVLTVPAVVRAFANR